MDYVEEEENDTFSRKMYSVLVLVFLVLVAGIAYVSSGEDPVVQVHAGESNYVDGTPSVQSQQSSEVGNFDYEGDSELINSDGPEEYTGSDVKQIEESVGCSGIKKYDVIFVGDSIISGHSLKSSDAIPGAFAKISGFECKNAGVAGDVYPNIYERVKVESELKPDYIVIEGGINNFSRNGDALYVLNCTEESINACLSNGVVPVVMAVLPFNGLTEDQMYQVDLYNEKLRDYTARHKGVIFVDARASVGARVNGKWVMREDYSTDGLHLNSAGAKLVANKIYNKMFPVESVGASGGNGDKNTTVNQPANNTTSSEVTDNTSTDIPVVIVPGNNTTSEVEEEETEQADTVDEIEADEETDAEEEQDDNVDPVEDDTNNDDTGDSDTGEEGEAEETDDDEENETTDIPVNDTEEDTKNDDAVDEVSDEGNETEDNTDEVIDESNNTDSGADDSTEDSNETDETEEPEEGPEPENENSSIIDPALS